MGRGEKAAPEKRRFSMKQLFVDDRGLRAIWRLAVALAAYIAVALGVRLGVQALLAALFKAWNLHAGTVVRAPGWARTLYAWQGSLATLAVNLAVIALCVFLRRRLFGLTAVPRGHSIRNGLVAWLVGTGVTLLTAVIFLLTDSWRPEWPLNWPNLTPGLPVLWAISLLGALSGTLFAQGVLFDGLRGRWGAVWAGVVAVIVGFFQRGGLSGNVMSAINVLLLGAAGLLIYMRRGLWASAGFTWGWSFAVSFLMGFGGGDRAVWRLYGVSEKLLTGGDAGPVYGLWFALLLTIPMAILIVQWFRKRKKAE